MKKILIIISLQVICGALEISSTFDDKQDFNDYSNITIPISVSALDSSTMTLNVNIDGNTFTQQVYSGYNSYIYPSTLKTVGVHTVSMQVVTDIYSSNTLEFTIIMMLCVSICFRHAKITIYQKPLKRKSLFYNALTDNSCNMS